MVVNHSALHRLSDKLQDQKVVLVAFHDGHMAKINHLYDANKRLELRQVGRGPEARGVRELRHLDFLWLGWRGF